MENFVEILIHSVKATRYRFTKATEGANATFGDYRVDEQARTPKEIVNHMYDLASKTKQMITTGNFNCPSPQMLGFLEEKKRFLNCLNELEATLLTATVSLATGKKLLQGPILDMATHVGQLAMLNGLSGNKVPRESYYNADI